MLCEASSVIKAIEEAWDKSGKPVEFSVKILEQGKKGFLWFGGEPTIISFAYEPKKQPNRPSEKPKHTSNNQPDRQRQHPSQNAYQQPSAQHQKAHQAPKSQQVKVQTPQPKPLQHKELPVQQSKPINTKAQEPKENINHWTNEFVENISQNLNDLCSILTIKTPYAIRTDNRKLHITFESRLLGASDEKMLFISLSYLLMQFVKKRFKKKFRGFHLILKSKDSEAHDDEQAPSE